MQSLNLFNDDYTMYQIRELITQSEIERLRKRVKHFETSQKIYNEYKNSEFSKVSDKILKYNNYRIDENIEEFFEIDKEKHTCKIRTEEEIIDFVAKEWVYLIGSFDLFADNFYEVRVGSETKEKFREKIIEWVKEAINGTGHCQLNDILSAIYLWEQFQEEIDVIYHE